MKNKINVPIDVLQGTTEAVALQQRESVYRIKKTVPQINHAIHYGAGDLIHKMEEKDIKGCGTIQERILEVDYKRRNFLGIVVLQAVNVPIDVLQALTEVVIVTIENVSRIAKNVQPNQMIKTPSGAEVQETDIGISGTMKEISSVQEEMGRRREYKRRNSLGIVVLQAVNVPIDVLQGITEAVIVTIENVSRIAKNVQPNQMMGRLSGAEVQETDIGISGTMKEN